MHYINLFYMYKYQWLKKYSYSNIVEKVVEYSWFTTLMPLILLQSVAVVSVSKKMVYFITVWLIATEIWANWFTLFLPFLLPAIYYISGPGGLIVLLNTFMVPVLWSLLPRNWRTILFAPGSSTIAVFGIKWNGFCRCDLSYGWHISITFRRVICCAWCLVLQENWKILPFHSEFSEWLASCK